VLENNVANMKEHIKRFVKDFVKNETELDTRRFPIEHFTCTKIGPGDYPWEIDVAPLGQLGPGEGASSVLEYGFGDSDDEMDEEEFDDSNYP